MHPESSVVVDTSSEPQGLAETGWKNLRDAGIEQAAQHAEAVDPGWKDTAYAMLEQFTRERRGCLFTSEDVRRWCELRGFDSPVPKAWGGIFQKAARRGLIRRVGFSIAKQRHGSPCPQWEVA